ncbi:Fc.00g048490.m01.CDS01 [Cosmosporella sp. VM-42]
MFSSHRVLRSCKPSSSRLLIARSGSAPSTSWRRLHQSSKLSVQASARQFAFESPNKGELPPGLKEQLGVSSKSYETPSEFQASTVLDGSIDGGKRITVSSSDKFIQIEDKEHGGWTRLYSTTLRDSCTCVKCTDPASGQKNFATTDVPANVEIENIRFTSGGVGISFQNDIQRLARDGHEMVLPWDIIEKALEHRAVEKLTYPRQDAIYPKTGRTFWDTETIHSRIRRIDYHEFIKGDEAFWQTLLDLANLGLVFLKNVPHDENSIVNITTRIANIKETFYGRTFDVRAKPDAENVAYTSGYLGLHQDLLYLERPPAIQLLHCMENSCSGGESLFSDGLRAGKLLWLQENRDAVENLARVLVPYHYEKHGYWYKQKRPLLSTTEDGILASVYWSPPFQDRFPLPTADLRAWLEPAQLFDQLINDERAMYQVKMNPGECVLFDNLRVMHGRRAFDASGGSRWLRGAYIEREDFVSRVLHVPEAMAEEYRGGEAWVRAAEDEKLRSGDWFGAVRTTLDGLVSGLREKGVTMAAEDHLHLNGEFLDRT